jgi:hypothetical protein
VIIKLTWKKRPSREDREEWKTKSKEQMQEAFDRINQITQQYIENPENITELLEFGSKFYTYSLRNNMLIFKQNPYASYVQSYQAWKEMGYSVLSGEHGLKILVPVKATTLKLEDGSYVMLQDATKEQKQEFDKGELQGTSRIHFKIGTVFDISQTNYPKEKYPELYAVGYPSEMHFGIYQGLKEYCKTIGYNVEESDLQSISLRGDCNYQRREIRINNILEDTQKLSTLSHELGHALCTEGLHDASTAKKELIADAVSIMIQSNFGIEITDSRKRHLKSHYDSLKKEIESEIGHEMSADEMSDQLNEILSDTMGMYKEHIEDINKCVEIYVPQDRLREYEQDKQYREDFNNLKNKDIERTPEINKVKDVELELEV